MVCSSGGGSGGGGGGGDVPENGGEGAAGIFVSPVHLRHGLLDGSFGVLLKESQSERDKQSLSPEVVSPSASSPIAAMANGIEEATQAFQIRLIVMVLVAFVVEWASIDLQSVDDGHTCPASGTRNAIAGTDAGTSVIDTVCEYSFLSNIL